MEALRTSGETRTWIILRSGWFLTFLSFNFFCAFSAIGTVIELFANRHKRKPSTEEIRQHGTLDAPTLLKYRTCRARSPGLCADSDVLYYGR